MRRAGIVLVLLPLLAGCAGRGETVRETPVPAVALEALGAALAGDYVAIRHIGEPGPGVTLRVDPAPHAAGLALQLSQRQAEDERRFRVELEPGPLAERFAGRFIPLQQQGGTAACPMSFSLAAGRLVGTTDPLECRFQSGELQIGLLKEIAFEGDRILMADQLLLPDGSPLRETDRLSLARLVYYSGTFAQREGNMWRIARNLELSSQGNLIEPLDAAGMSLGVLLNLEMVHTPEQDIPALRLQVLAEADERILAEVWSDIGADLIGLSLGDLRLELQRMPDGVNQR